MDKFKRMCTVGGVLVHMPLPTFICTYVFAFEREMGILMNRQPPPPSPALPTSSILVLLTAAIEEHLRLCVLCIRNQQEQQQRTQECTYIHTYVCTYVCIQYLRNEESPTQHQPIQVNGTPQTWLFLFLVLPHCCCSPQRSERVWVGRRGGGGG